MRRRESKARAIRPTIGRSGGLVSGRNLATSTATALLGWLLPGEPRLRTGGHQALRRHRSGAPRTSQTVRSSGEPGMSSGELGYGYLMDILKVRYMGEVLPKVGES